LLYVVAPRQNNTKQPTYWPPFIAALYATGGLVKYLVFLTLLINTSVFAQEEVIHPKIQELKKQEVVLNAYFYLHQLGKIRKKAFEDNALKTIEVIDKSILDLITDSMIYHPEFNREMADYVLDFIGENNYYQFMWSPKSNEQLLHALKSIKR
jgi:hypothetical protein